MWSIIAGIFLGFTGCVVLLITQEIEASVPFNIAGIAATLYGLARLLRTPAPAQVEPEPTESESKPTEPPAQQDEAPPAEEHTAGSMPAESPDDKPAQGSDKSAPPNREKTGEDIQTGAQPDHHTAGDAKCSAPVVASDPYHRGLRYMFALDRANGLKKATGCFIEAYEKGNLNAGYMLCHCYREGKGVPVKPAFVVQLAEYLVRRQYFPAYFYLAAAYREGRGVPLNRALAAEYAKKFEDLCSQPLVGVDELLRYDALISHELQKDEPDLRSLERLARENYRISHLPSRYSILALSLLRDAHCSVTARNEAKRLLEEGCQADDMGCYYLRGLLLCSESALLYAPDAQRGLEYLRVAAEREGSPAALQAYLHHLNDDALAAATLERYWNACRWGISGIQGSDELLCLISCMQTGLLRTEGSLQPYPPRILLENKSPLPLQNALMRICSIDSKTELTITLPPMEPGECTVIRPEDHHLEPGKTLYIEVHAQGRFSRIYLHAEDVLRKFVRIHAA